MLVVVGAFLFCSEDTHKSTLEKYLLLGYLRLSRSESVVWMKGILDADDFIRVRRDGDLGKVE